MVLRALWNTASRAGTVLLAFFLGSQAWEALGPNPPAVSPLRVDIAETVLPDIVKDLREARRDNGTVALLPLAGDTSGYITERLRAIIGPSGILDLREKTAMEKARGLLGLRETGVGDPANARNAGEALGVQGVLFGNVRAFESFGGDAALDLDVRLLDIASGALLLDRRYTKETTAGFLNTAKIQEEMAQINAPKRFFVWLLAVLLLPVFTIGFIRAMVRKDTNQHNAMTLAIYSIADALLAWLLLGAAISTWVSVALFIVAVAAAVWYNLLIMRFALHLEN